MTERYCLVEPYDPAALAMKSQRLYTSRLFAYRDEQQRERDMQRERAAMGVAMGLGAAGGQEWSWTGPFGGGGCPGAGVVLHGSGARRPCEAPPPRS